MRSAWVIVSTVARRTLSGRIYRRKYKGEESGPYWVEYYDGQGGQHRESSKSLKVGDARRLLEKRIAEVRSGHHGGLRAERVMVGDLLDLVLDDYAANGKRVEFAQGCANVLRPALGTMRANRVTSAVLNKYVLDRRKAGSANGTINRHLAILRRGFNLAARETPPLVVRVPNFPLLKVAPARAGFFSPAEYRALMGELEPHAQNVVAFAYQTGCRHGELLQIRWSQVDLDERSIRLNPGETKNKSPREIPLTKDLHQRLTAMLMTRNDLFPECPWVFSRAGKQIKDIRGAWEGASKRAAAVCPSLWDSDRNRHARIFHDLRRTGARNLVRAGVPEATVMAIGGWKTRAMFDRYNVVSGDDLQQAAGKLDEYLSGSDSNNTRPKQGQNRSKPKS
jgi:integrase